MPQNNRTCDVPFYLELFSNFFSPGEEEYEYDGEDCVYSDHDIFFPEDFVTRDDVRCQKCGYENSWKIFDGKPFSITLSVRS